MKKEHQHYACISYSLKNDPNIPYVLSMCVSEKKNTEKSRLPEAKNSQNPINYARSHAMKVAGRPSEACDLIT